jgi:hypothetical protein
VDEISRLGVRDELDVDHVAVSEVEDRWLADRDIDAVHRAAGLEDEARSELPSYRDSRGRFGSEFARRCVGRRWRSP